MLEEGYEGYLGGPGEGNRDDGILFQFEIYLKKRAKNHQRDYRIPQVNSDLTFGNNIQHVMDRIIETLEKDREFGRRTDRSLSACSRLNSMNEDLPVS